MTNSTNNVPKSQISDKNVYKADIYEAEINLIDYFEVFWKRKHFVILVAFLLALVVDIVFFFHPKIIKQLMFTMLAVMQISRILKNEL